MPFSSNNADTGLNLQDTYLKYMGWLVYDLSPAVRGTAL